MYEIWCWRAIKKEQKRDKLDLPYLLSAKVDLILELLVPELIGNTLKPEYCM